MVALDVTWMCFWFNWRPGKRGDRLECGWSLGGWPFKQMVVCSASETKHDSEWNLSLWRHSLESFSPLIWQRRQCIYGEFHGTARCLKLLCRYRARRRRTTCESWNNEQGSGSEGVEETKENSYGAIIQSPTRPLIYSSPRGSCELEWEAESERVRKEVTWGENNLESCMVDSWLYQPTLERSSDKCSCFELLMEKWNNFFWERNVGIQTEGAVCLRVKHHQGLRRHCSSRIRKNDELATCTHSLTQAG